MFGYNTINVNFNLCCTDSNFIIACTVLYVQFCASQHMLPLIIFIIFPYAVGGLHVSLQEFLSYLRFLPVDRVL
jgi:hypothetical protein